MSYPNCIKEYVKHRPLDHLTQPVGDELGPRLVPSMTSQVLHQPNYWIAEAQPRPHIFYTPDSVLFLFSSGILRFQFLDPDRMPIFRCAKSTEERLNHRKVSRIHLLRFKHPRRIAWSLKRTSNIPFAPQSSLQTARGQVHTCNCYKLIQLGTVFSRAEMPRRSVILFLAKWPTPSSCMPLTTRMSQMWYAFVFVGSFMKHEIESHRRCDLPYLDLYWRPGKTYCKGLTSIRLPSAPVVPCKELFHLPYRSG
jgi:hypothetical protein